MREGRASFLPLPFFLWRLSHWGFCFNIFSHYIFHLASSLFHFSHTLFLPSLNNLHIDIIVSPSLLLFFFFLNRHFSWYTLEFSFLPHFIFYIIFLSYFFLLEGHFSLFLFSTHFLQAGFFPSSLSDRDITHRHIFISLLSFSESLIYLFFHSSSATFCLFPSLHIFFSSSFFFSFILFLFLILPSSFLFIIITEIYHLLFSLRLSQTFSLSHFLHAFII